MRNGIFRLVTGTALAIALSATSAYAQKKYDTGANDTEIKVADRAVLRSGLPYARSARQAAY